MDAWHVWDRVREEHENHQVLTDRASLRNLVGSVGEVRAGEESAHNQHMGWAGARLPGAFLVTRSYRTIFGACAGTRPRLDFEGLQVYLCSGEHPPSIFDSFIKFYQLHFQSLVGCFVDPQTFPPAQISPAAPFLAPSSTSRDSLPLQARNNHGRSTGRQSKGWRCLSYHPYRVRL